jgi:hypothetical protein
MSGVAGVLGIPSASVLFSHRFLLRQGINREYMVFRLDIGCFYELLLQLLSCNSWAGSRNMGVTQGQQVASAPQGKQRVSEGGTREDAI